MVNGFSLSRQPRRRQAFTLAELLIVIAIIAVLISVLLPSLAAARRSAATVKCLSSLRNIGTAFQQYAQDNHRFFPVVRWCPSTGAVVSGHPEWGPGGVSSTDNPNNTTERNWIDFLSRYLIKTSTNGDPRVYGQYQNTSVFWGCPAYSADNWNGAVLTPAADARANSLSYGMSMYAAPQGPYYNNVYLLPTPVAPNPDGQRLTVGLGTIANVAYIGTGLSPIPSYVLSGGKGQFYKMEQWGRHSQDKGLIADSNGFDLIASTNWTKTDDLAANAAVGTEPANMGMAYPHPAAGLLPTSYISVDATRHLAPTANKSKVMRGRGINMLFVDGHATSVSPREAWIATMGGGLDTTQ